MTNKIILILAFLLFIPFSLAERMSGSDGSALAKEALVEAPEVANYCYQLTQGSLQIEELEDIKANCLSFLKETSPAAVVRGTSNAKYSFFVHEGVFALEEAVSGRQFILSGNRSGLKNSRAVYLDEKNNEAFVLSEDDEGSQQILVFPLGETGNLSPLRNVNHKSLKGIDDISVNVEKNEIYALNSNEKKLFIYNRLATEHSGSHAQFSQKPKAELDLSFLNALSLSAVASDAVTNTLYLLDKDQARIFSLDVRDIHNPILEKTYSSSQTSLVRPSLLTISMQGHLEVYDQGEIIRFSLREN